MILPLLFHLVGGARGGANRLNVGGDILQLVEAGVGVGLALLLVNHLNRSFSNFLLEITRLLWYPHRCSLCTIFLLGSCLCRVSNLSDQLPLLVVGVVGEVEVEVGRPLLGPIPVLVRRQQGRIFES